MLERLAEKTIDTAINQEPNMKVHESMLKPRYQIKMILVATEMIM